MPTYSYSILTNTRVSSGNYEQGSHWDTTTKIDIINKSILLDNDNYTRIHFWDNNNNYLGFSSHLESTRYDPIFSFQKSRNIAIPKNATAFAVDAWDLSGFQLHVVDHSVFASNTISYLSTVDYSGSGGEGVYYGDKFTYHYGTVGWFAGGGGGGARNDSGGLISPGAGGAGGGGTGGSDFPAIAGYNGSGGGGGGAPTDIAGAAGGSGVVLVRYPFGTQGINNLKIGQSQINTLYKGTNEIKKVYKGQTILFQSSVQVDATGGTIIDENIDGTNYRIHAFTSVGTSTFTVSDLGGSSLSCDVLVVAGGGGGGGSSNSRSCGGGGAGGLIFNNNFVINSPTSISLTVGAGGSAGGRNQQGGDGGNSSFDNITATGGGGGAGVNNFMSGRNGGSGGGANNFNAFNNEGSGISGQGFRGGNGSRDDAYAGTGGGGGAGGVGQDGQG